MHLYLNGFRDFQNFSVISRTDQLVVDCTPAPQPLPTPAVPPLTPAPQSVPKPPGDVTPPKATPTVTKTRELRKLGLKKLVRGGLPIKVTTSEPATLVGTLTLLGGKVPFVAPVRIPVVKGTTAVQIQLPNALRKALRKIDGGARLRLAVALVDRAGNRTTLPPLAVNVPGR